ncbi:MAG: hypothetical protein RR420_01205 [Anaerovoracaceae bacterium]
MFAKIKNFFGAFISFAKNTQIFIRELDSTLSKFENISNQFTDIQGKISDNIIEASDYVKCQKLISYMKGICVIDKICNINIIKSDNSQFGITAKIKEFGLLCTSTSDGDDWEVWITVQLSKEETKTYSIDPGSCETAVVSVLTQVDDNGKIMS